MGYASDNVEMFPGVTTKDFDPDMMLEKAVGNVSSVVIIGWDKEGDLFFSSSEADGADILWLLEKAKAMLLAAGEEL